MQRSPRLSGDERQVLSLAAEGLTHREVAYRLNVPLERVRECLSSACTALGARSKLEAIVLASRLGEIDLSP